MESPSHLFQNTDSNPNPDCNRSPSSEAAEKKKVVVIMGATGSGKSRLAIDLASHFAGVEVINADSMQVYRGLDVLTNKVPLLERKGVPHHLLGTIDSSAEFTSRDFRDLAIPIIEDILSRNCLPVIVGGTNYYIQALVSPFLIDDVVEDSAESTIVGTQDKSSQDLGNADLADNYERLKEVDPIAANRIHPNDHRKINRYLSLYACSGVLPSTLFQGKAAEKWGRADIFRYNCCFIWLDVSLPVLDMFVDRRVDDMLNAGLLNEVHDIYKPEADYTRGLRQAIGVREFEDFFRCYFANAEASDCSCIRESGIATLVTTAGYNSLMDISESNDSKLKCILHEAVDKLKFNTKRLVRRQLRRLNRLKTYFEWNLHYVDATEAFLCDSEESWRDRVLEPCIDIVKSFLSEEVGVSVISAESSDVQSQNCVSRDLWSQYVCEACGNQILRGAHEWEQHKQGRGHRKRILRLKKKLITVNRTGGDHFKTSACDGLSDLTI